jgi:hypothetical protein
MKNNLILFEDYKIQSRVNREGSESVTKCNRLKLEATDGKKYLTDVANVEIILPPTISYVESCLANK